MTISITMPALSPTMEEGNLAKWHVKVGDKVKAGDIIAEIETDKATMEVEAVDEGVISKLLVAEGAQGVKVNAVIAELTSEGEAPSPKADARPPQPRAGEVAAKQTERAGSKETNSGPPGPRPASAPQRAPAASANVATNAGQGPGGPEGARIKASPLAKRLAKQEGVDLLALKGSGPHGRIIKSRTC